MDELSVDVFNSLYGKDIRVIGLRKEKYIGEMCRGFNCDFEYTQEELTRDVVCIESEGKKYEMAMETEYC